MWARCDMPTSSWSACSAVQPCRAIKMPLAFLAETVDRRREPWRRWFGPQRRDQLARLKTSFAKVSVEDCRELVYGGWWLSRATLSPSADSSVVPLMAWSRIRLAGLEHALLAAAERGSSAEINSHIARTCRSQPHSPPKLPVN